MPPLVSILIPAYNSACWIGETLSSAAGQTWPRTEVIVVDDGSTDATLHVARTFASKTVKVVTQPNSGAAAARNRALSLAQGDFIQWLDADDLLAPDKISRQMARAAECQPDMPLSSPFATFYYRHRTARFIPNSLWQDLSPVEWFLRKFNDHVYMIPAAWLVSRELTEKVGPWDERLSLDDDGEYFGRMVAACKSVNFVAEARTYYRQANPGSLSRNYSHRACQSLLLSKTLCVRYLRSLEDTPRTRSAALKYLQWAMICFYPEKKELLDRLYCLAEDLGGTLSPPRLNRKYFLVRKVLGWHAAKQLAMTLPACRRRIPIAWDRFLHGLDRAKRPLLKTAQHTAGGFPAGASK